jgi:hypothetical protein
MSYQLQYRLPHGRWQDYPTHTKKDLGLTIGLAGVVEDEQSAAAGGPVETRILRLGLRGRIRGVAWPAD